MRHLILLLALALACTTTAQPTWRFHLAFEDGTGARDTIWMIYDTSATVGSDFQPQVDYALGEGDAQLDYTRFNVFTWNWDGDSTKIHAYPYTEFPNFDGTIIDAINWTPPMTITWDTSLFHAPYLPYDQGHIGLAVMNGLAFSQFNDGTLDFGMLSMLIRDSVQIDFLSEYLFAFAVYFDAVDDIAVAEHDSGRTTLRVWPNPAHAVVHIESPGSRVQELFISDVAGRQLLELAYPGTTGPLDVSTLGPGTYFITLRTNQNQRYHATLQKIP
ncbi:MAG: T9SS type A sorting domain-containing protein [Flavobacteriales bacterium]|nr:T9SS type A sorting domain-containing protein [Flavobacteriales bacterium]